LLLADTGASPFPWGAVLVRVGNAVDTSQAVLDGFLNVERGDIIRIVGRIDEFPAGNMNSVTQFVPIPGRPIVILGSAPIPQFVNKIVPNFYTGLFPGGRVNYSGGEPYEGALVNLELPLTVNERLNAPRGTFSVVDGSGNMLSDYDASRYFTLKGTSADHPFPDSIWTIEYPNVGAVINTLRGFMTTVSGSESPRGYRVSPLYYGDVGIGLVLPSITTHRRSPIVVPPDSAARISVRATRLLGGYPITNLRLLYSLNNAPFVTLTMTFQSSDTTYIAQIPQQAQNTFVHYFIEATDSAGNKSRLASSAFGSAASDTSKGFFFYTVLNRALTIQDIQQTPYTNGRTPYLGATVSVNGVVTADTANIGVAPLNTGGTNAWYMQTGIQPWNGLWFVPSVSDSLARLRNGDSVTVTGSVAEQFDVTRLENVSAAVRSSGRPEPLPIVSTTGNFGPIVGNGTPAAERYEGMLVRLNTVRVSSIDPVFSDPTEFEVDDGSGPIIVRRDGTHRYSNVTGDSIFGKTILRVGNRISFLQGVIYFSFNRYKIVPRKNTDFGTVTSVDIQHNPSIPDQYSLSQNYPNPFNPATIIEYALPTTGLATLKVYNLLGQEVATLVNAEQAAGKYTLRFDASRYASGVYFYRLQAGAFVTTKKMLLAK
jgi:hypothetical protein